VTFICCFHFLQSLILVRSSGSYSPGGAVVFCTTDENEVDRRVRNKMPRSVQLNKLASLFGHPVYTFGCAAITPPRCRYSSRDYSPRRLGLGVRVSASLQKYPAS